ncbi:MAG: ribonuclease P protein component [Candidatus Zambryskibacteria bacterium]|nr:ribonuclease P protein component [Candidatus Zambryskibacteria bacterium]
MAHFYLRVTRGDVIKIIISISKKISKKAVIRNKIRRRVRPVMQKLKSRLKPANYFIIAKPGAENIRGKELEAEISSIMVRQAHHK